VKYPRLLLCTCLWALSAHGQNWTLKTPGTSPPPRLAGAMAYDPGTMQVILFGGRNATAAFGDTWAWNGYSWTQLIPPNSPPARHGHAMAYDPVFHEVVLYGGYDLFETPFYDTWTWDGATWRQRHTSGPSWNTPVGLVLDTANQAFRLWGGDSGRVWTWNNHQWFSSPDTPGPSWRRGHAIGWDPVSSKLLVFGGNTVLNDTWLWTPPFGPWMMMNPPLLPEGRYVHSIAEDPGARRLLLFGGHNYTLPVPMQFFNDTWLWTGSRWEMQSPANRPEGRWKVMLASDYSRGTVLLFGGQGPLVGPTNVVYGDTWVWETIRQPNLGVTMSASPVPVLTGSGTTFTADLGNTGNGHGTNVTATLTLPAGLTNPACGPGGCVTHYASFAPGHTERIHTPAMAGCDLPGGVPLTANMAVSAPGDSDLANNMAQATVVTTNPAPMIVPPADLNAGTGAGASSCGLTVSNLGVPQVSDNCPGWRTSVSGVPAGSFFPVGVTVVTHTAIDSGGASSSASQRVTVRDTTAPAAGPLVPDITELWPPNHKMRLVTLRYPGTDNCGPANCALSITANEPAEGDFQVLDARRVMLRATRLGNANGRVYRITATCTDGAGNTSSSSAVVTVPHDRRP